MICNIRETNQQLERLFNNFLGYFNSIYNIDDLKELSSEELEILMTININVCTEKNELILLTALPVDNNGQRLNKIPNGRHIYYDISMSSDEIIDLSDIYVEPLTGRAFIFKHYSDLEFKRFIAGNISRMREMLLINESNPQVLEEHIRNCIIGTDGYPTLYSELVIEYSNFYTDLSEFIKYAPKLIAINYLAGYIPLFTLPPIYKQVCYDKFLHYKKDLVRDIESYTNVISPISIEMAEPRKMHNSPLNIYFVHYKLIPNILERWC